MRAVIRLRADSLLGAGSCSQLEVNVFRLQLYRFMAMIFLASHWVGCTFYFLARLQGFSQDTWIVRFQHVMPLFNLDTSSMAQRYIVIMYKGFNVLSNISYGERFNFASWCCGILSVASRCDVVQPSSQLRLNTDSTHPLI